VNKDPLKKIIVIDDSKAALALYGRSVEGLPVEMQTFSSPGDALLHLRDHDADLVLLDTLLREDDGLTVLGQLRHIPRHSDTAAIIITSKDYLQDRTVARELGVVAYLVKPLRSQEIREIICKYTHLPLT